MDRIKLAYIMLAWLLILMVVFAGVIFMSMPGAAQESNNTTDNTTEQPDNSVIKQLGEHVTVVSEKETSDAYRVEVVITGNPQELTKAWKNNEWFPDKESVVLMPGRHTVVIEKKDAPTALLHANSETYHQVEGSSGEILDRDANPIYTWGIAISTSIVGLAVYVRREVNKEKNEETKLID